MDSYEAARAVFSRIQAIDPENASKIIAYVLLQDQADKEMIRLAYGPENLVRSLISTAKSELGISSSPTPSSPFTNSSNPISISISKPHPLSLSLSSPRFSGAFNSPSSPSVWSPRHPPLSPEPNHSLSYAAVLNNGSSSPLGLKNVDFLDPSFELAISPGGRSDSAIFPPHSHWDNSTAFDNNGGGGFHRRSCSVNDACFGTDDSTSGFGYKPCLYFARGFCKNGTACKFVHGGAPNYLNSGENGAIVGSPCKYDAFDHDLVRSKFPHHHHQRLAAAQYMAGINFPYNKLNFIQTEAQKSAAAAAALIIGDDFHKFSRSRMGRGDFSGMGCGDSNPGARQIYLTFPADSTFKEEDVSNYFSIYGPVQDVRIPYQQKRMFGFVTFVYPETVKIILAKGNPHFVCDSRVLVKPYKEKSKLPDKKQHQHDRSDFSSCSSPSALDREPFEMHVGPRMFYNNPEMMLRKKLEEQADWQQALELQGRRLMNLQLMDLKNHHRFRQNHAGSPPTSLNHSHASLNRTLSSNGALQDGSEENKGSPTTAAAGGHLQEEINATSSEGNSGGSSKEDNLESKDFDLPESFEHILPDSLFTSPTKLGGEDRAIFSPKRSELGNGTISASSANNDFLLSPASSLNIAPQKSCFLEIPRFSSGHEAIGM